jgi:predicted GTPase
MPQTREAIDHAKAAKVPIIVAINKIDKSGVDPEKVKFPLADLDLMPEEWGGKTIYRNISAKVGTGIKELLETIITVAEVSELKANPALTITVTGNCNEKEDSVATKKPAFGNMDTKRADAVKAFNAAKSTADAFTLIVATAPTNDAVILAPTKFNAVAAPNETPSS